MRIPCAFVDMPCGLAAEGRVHTVEATVLCARLKP
jgi:hypothetical protein